MPLVIDKLTVGSDRCVEGMLPLVTAAQHPARAVIPDNPRVDRTEGIFDKCLQSERARRNQQQYDCESFQPFDGNVRGLRIRGQFISAAGP